MRVKLLVALAIVSVLLFCSGVVAAAASTDTSTPTATDLTNAADQDISSYGFPDLGASDLGASDIGASDLGYTAIPSTGDILADALTPTSKLETPDVTGVIPDSTVTDTLNNIAGPVVGLSSPEVNAIPVPVDITTPVICQSFAPILLAPEVDLGLPQVNLCLNSFDIDPAFIDP